MRNLFEIWNSHLRKHLFLRLHILTHLLIDYLYETYWNCTCNSQNFYDERSLEKQIIDVVSHGTIPFQYLRTINSDYFFHLISNLKKSMKSIAYWSNPEQFHHKCSTSMIFFISLDDAVERTYFLCASNHPSKDFFVRLNSFVK